MGKIHSHCLFDISFNIQISNGWWWWCYNNLFFNNLFGASLNPFFKKVSLADQSFIHTSKKNRFDPLTSDFFTEKAEKIWKYVLRRNQTWNFADLFGKDKSTHKSLLIHNSYSIAPQICLPPFVLYIYDFLASKQVLKRIIGDDALA